MNFFVEVAAVTLLRDPVAERRPKLFLSTSIHPSGEFRGTYLLP